MASLWDFMSFRDGGSHPVIDEWYRAQTATVRAEFDETVLFLSQRPRNDWDRPPFALLTGKDEREIGELRFKADRVQWRPLGCFGPTRMQDVFTFLLGASKKGKVWTPKAAIKTAISRRKGLKDGSRSAAMSTVACKDVQKSVV